LAVCALLGTLCTSAQAAPLLVSADATVAGGLLADATLGATSIGGGLLSGSDGSALIGPYRFYLTFPLPAFQSDTFIAAATLQGSYNQDWDTFDDRTHSLYEAPSTWSESTITWNNQPGAVGGPLAAFNAAQAVPGALQSWDVTPAVNTAYLQQRQLLSILFRADDEAPGGPPVLNHNLEYFASREFGQGSRAFRLDVEVATVPEPGTLILLAAGLAGAIRRGRRARR
jgi:hypothetical protein